MALGSALQSAVWKRAFGSVASFSIKQRPGTFILDPLSVMVVLATNAYKPIGTKLYLGNGILELHDSGLLQGTVRAWVGENKMNIKLLNHPIIFACKHYFQVKSIKDVPEDIVFLFTQAKKGLDNLKHTYREDRDLNICINTYINIIAATMEMRTEAADVLDMLITLKLSDIVSLPNPRMPARDSESDLQSQTEQTQHEPERERSAERFGAAQVKGNLYDELHRSWDKNRIDTVIGLIKELEYASPFGRKHVYVAIDSFMMCIHERTKQVSETVFDVN